MTVAEDTETRGSAIGDLPGRRRLIIGGVGILFWAWLGLRWAYHNTLVDWLATMAGQPALIQSEQAVRAREPLLPAEPLEVAASDLAAVGSQLGPVGTFIDWVAWLVDLAAFATTVEPALAAGAFITVYLTILSMLFGFIIAVPLAVMRVYGGRITRGLALTYTELIRGTPLLAQLFFLYFGLSLASYIDAIGIVGQPGIPQPAVFVAIIGFTINSSAYQAEYIRSALQSVDAGQMLAARAVGLSSLQSIRHVILPQGLRYAIPGWTNEFVYLIKYSSLAAFITVPELFRRAQDIASASFRVTDIYIIVGLLYLALVLTTALAMGRLESTLAIPGVTTSQTRK